MVLVGNSGGSRLQCSYCTALLDEGFYVGVQSMSVFTSWTLDMMDFVYWPSVFSYRHRLSITLYF